MSKILPNGVLAFSVLALSVGILGLPSAAVAQNRSLPKAGFNNYSGAGGSLPNAGGVSLQEGADRPKGAPAEVYNPGEPTQGHKLVRWEARFMPLRVWVSPGKKLNEEPVSVMTAQRPQEVLNLLNSGPQSLLNLPQARGWTPDMSESAKQGIEQWKEFEREGLFSFEFVDDPSIANIFVFWDERISGDESAGGVSTAGLTTATLYDANLVHSTEANLAKPVAGSPVVIDLRSSDPEKVNQQAAHEFGHALGIKEHSPYNQDIMCVNGIARVLSPADRATIRWLYKQRTAFIMLPPIVQRNQAAIQNAQAADQQRSAQDYGQERPSNAYRVHVGSGTAKGSAAASTDTLPIEDPGTGSSAYKSRGSANTHQQGPYTYTPLSEISRSKGSEIKENKKPKERKPKQNKDSDPETQPTQSGDNRGTQTNKTKASDGF